MFSIRPVSAFTCPCDKVQQNLRFCCYRVAVDIVNKRHDRI